MQQIVQIKECGQFKRYVWLNGGLIPLKETVVSPKWLKSQYQSLSPKLI